VAMANRPCRKRSSKSMLGPGAREVSVPAAAVRPGMRFAYVKYPEGNLLELVERARS
jgi:hypothetical protein